MSKLKREFFHHWVYYIILITFQLLGLSLLILTSFDKQFQLIIMTMMTVFYVFSALIHHLLSHDINPKIVVEYILMGSLGLSIAFFVLRLI